jgi:hypothetical protein
MKIKLDENISRHLKPLLNEKGHETVTAEDESWERAMSRLEKLRKPKAGCSSPLTLNLQTCRSFRLEAILV